MPYCVMVWWVVVPERMLCLFHIGKFSCLAVPIVDGRLLATWVFLALVFQVCLALLAIWAVLLRLVVLVVKERRGAVLAPLDAGFLLVCVFW